MAHNCTFTGVVMVVVVVVVMVVIVVVMVVMVMAMVVVVIVMVIVVVGVGLVLNNSELLLHTPLHVFLFFFRNHRLSVKLRCSRLKNAFGRLRINERIKWYC